MDFNATQLYSEVRQGSEEGICRLQQQERVREKSDVTQASQAGAVQAEERNVKFLDKNIFPSVIILSSKELKLQMKFTRYKN